MEFQSTRETFGILQPSDDFLQHYNMDAIVISVCLTKEGNYLCKELNTKDPVLPIGTSMEKVSSKVYWRVHLALKISKNSQSSLIGLQMVKRIIIRYTPSEKSKSSSFLPFRGKSLFWWGVLIIDFGNNVKLPVDNSIQEKTFVAMDQKMSLAMNQNGLDHCFPNVPNSTGHP